MDAQTAGRVLAALVICSGHNKGCDECPAYDIEATGEAQQKRCNELLSDSNIEKALETMRG